jgi:hypothetical protein
MSKEKVEYYERKILEAESYRYDIAINELIKLHADILADKEITDDEFKRLNEIFSKVINHVSTRQPEFD